MQKQPYEWGFIPSAQWGLDPLSRCEQFCAHLKVGRITFTICSRKGVFP